MAQLVGREIETEQVSMVIGPHWVVTFRWASATSSTRSAAHRNLADLLDEADTSPTRCSTR
jgi:hypothetical protein